MSDIGPDAVANGLLDGNLNVNGVALFLVLLVTNLLRNLVALGNSDVVALLFGYFGVNGNIDVVTFLLRYLFGNINVFARFMRDFLTFLFVVVGRFAFFGVGGMTFL